ncbi:tRNA-modifying protein YgfZ [Yersinia ruckeri]|uniref:tRNA-modifying protein YgfZ n=1 Tax=Yersinia ruckeri TaxID=29486 RepID=UPI000536E975|nr:tRNA-modifying protein YgfZ [Yersinia ruckeri]AUQ42085.1 tRNA-modifying protein YgfZ [Yersinia ruckeri]WMS06885.1 tRNA-modifying protein YgfZ [Yersinia ruckeri]
MAYATPLSTRKPSASSTLPLTLISLEDWALVTVTGADRVKYLQGQLTANVETLAPDQHVLTAHCDAKGKMWSDLRLFHRGESFAFIERRNLLENQLAELKKYAVFSKVTFAAPADCILLGVAGENAREALAQSFPELPTAEKSVVQCGETTLLHFTLPAERFLLVTKAIQVQNLIDKLGDQAQLNSSQQWLALEIEAGFPVIDSPNSAQFIPQATNIQALAGICFTKGCYTGQEMVARAKYRGANKRALYWLAGQAERVPEAGEDLEWQLGENWRRTGTVLAAVQLAEGSLWVQAVLNNDLAADSILRVREESTGVLNIQPLPYSLEEEK